MHAPEVLVLVDGANLTKRGQAAREDQPEILAEMALHLRLPLQHQTGRRDDEDPAHETADLQLAQDKARFDRLAETDLVGQEIPDAIPEIARCKARS